MPDRVPRHIFLVLLVVFSLSAPVVLRISVPDGIATSPDSYQYFSVARNMLGGEGYENFRRDPVVYWPPLYPVILAGLWALSDLFSTNLHILNVIGWLNAITFAGIVLASGVLFAQHIRSRALVVIATLAILFGAPEVLVSAYAWSEPLFVLFYIVFMIAFVRYLRTQRSAWLFSAAVIAALAGLQRWVGVFLIAAGSISILVMHGATLRKRIADAALFGIVSGLPVALWMARNLYVAGTIAGTRENTPRTLRVTYRQFYDTLVAWFLPDQFGIGYIIGTLLIGIALLVLAALFVRRHRGRSLTHLRAALPHTMLVLIIIYAAFFIIEGSVYNLSDIDDRFMVPVHTFVLCLAFMGVDGLLARTESRPWLNRAIIAGAALWLAVPIIQLDRSLPTLRVISESAQNTYDSWHESALIEALRDDAPAGRVYTNAPAHLLIHTGILNTRVPKTLAEWDTITGATRAPISVIWFYDIDGCDLQRVYCVDPPYTAADLHAALPFEITTTAADGIVLWLSSAPPPQSP